MYKLVQKWVHRDQLLPPRSLVLRDRSQSLGKTCQENKGVIHFLTVQGFGEKIESICSSQNKKRKLL